MEFAYLLFSQGIYFLSFSLTGVHTKMSGMWDVALVKSAVVAEPSFYGILDKEGNTGSPF